MWHGKNNAKKSSHFIVRLHNNLIIEEHITKLINSFQVFLAMHTFPICFVSSYKVKLIQIMIQRHAHTQILLCVCVSPSTPSPCVCVFMATIHCGISKLIATIYFIISYELRLLFIRTMIFMDQVNTATLPEIISHIHTHTHTHIFITSLISSI